MPTPQQLLHEPRFQPAWRALLALLALLAAVFAFTPGDSAPTLGISDKVDHLMAFGSMAWAGTLAFRPGRRESLRLALALLGYGVFIELVQTQIPGRSCEFGDVVADGLGIVVGLALAASIRRASKTPSP